MWSRTGGRYFLIDDLLSEALALDIFRRFPKPEEMMVKKSLREYKHVAAQMNKYEPLLEETVFAFQEQNVRDLIGDLVGMRGMLPDKRLYAGGISLMSKGQFLNPHLDNSHDNDRSNYRVLNLLYYTSPNWAPADGGNLELWPGGPRGKPSQLDSKFNRLIVMATNRQSWHSVNRVQVEANRCCVSNYYFSPNSPEAEEYFHVTSFRGRPEQPLRDLVLRVDIGARSALRKLFPRGVVQTKHIYKK
jgi:Rps23 Pro-64 3,4-dihydroxylase Tpa1-like proline 4-hydroxylase